MAVNKLQCRVTPQYRQINIEGQEGLQAVCEYLAALLKEFPEYKDYRVFIHTYNPPLEPPIAPPQCDFADREING